MLFLPLDRDAREVAMRTVERIVAEEGLQLLGWREVPRDREAIGWLARRNEPDIRQVFVGAPADISPDQFETRLFVTRKRSSLAIRNSGIPGTETYYAPQFLQSDHRLQGADAARGHGPVLRGPQG